MVVAILWKLMIIMMTQNSYQFVSLCFAFYIMNWLFEGKVIRAAFIIYFMRIPARTASTSTSS